MCVMSLLLTRPFGPSKVICSSLNAASISSSPPLSKLEVSIPESGCETSF